MKERVVFARVACAIIAAGVFCSAGKPAFAQIGQPKNNLNSCLNGLPSCDISQLTAADVKTVSNASQARNLSSCMKGLFSCDPTPLTTEEAREVNTLWDRRNAKSCVEGLVNCNPVQL